MTADTAAQDDEANAVLRSGTKHIGEMPAYLIPIFTNFAAQIARLTDQLAAAQEEVGRLKAKVETMYGLCWLAEIDRQTVTGRAIYAARQHALEVIDKAGQRRGIEAAVKEVPAP